MSIQQTKKQSDLEKRLQLLRRQVYGKSKDHLVESDEIKTNRQTSQPGNHTFQYTNTPIHQSTNTLVSSDLTYLRQDLLKIAIFSSLAIGAQVLLFFLLQNHILRINFF